MSYTMNEMMPGYDAMMQEEARDSKEVTSEYCVNVYDSVYDENGLFYCKWSALSASEKNRVKQNPASAR